MSRASPGRPISAAAWNQLVTEMAELRSLVQAGGAGLGRKPGPGLGTANGVLGLAAAGALPLARLVVVTTVRGNITGDVPANISYVVAFDREPASTLDTADPDVDLISRDCRSTDLVLLRPAVVGCVGLAWRWDVEDRAKRMAVWLPMGERGEVKVYADECG